MDTPIYETKRGGYTISTDPARLQPDEICAYLARSYWARNRPRETILRSLEHSLCFGVYRDGRQVGLARVISDYATFAYICDVYILEEHRGIGLGKWLIASLRAYPLLRDVGRWYLITRDAHGLYRRYGFTEIEHPERFMVAERQQGN